MLDKDERQHYIDMIEIYGGSPECCCNGCNLCSDEQIEECYSFANDVCNHSFAESIGYGGYESEEEFWDNLFD